MDRFEFQLAMLQKGAEELEKKIANFTTILMQLKTAAISIWVAVSGWVFASKNRCVSSAGIRYNFWFLVFRSYLLESTIVLYAKSR